MPMSPPRNIQELQASKLRDAQCIPFFINKIIRSSLKTLYFYCFTYYVLFLEHHFILLSVLFCLLAGNKWLDPSILVWRETHSILLFRTLQFSLLLLCECLVFATAIFSSCCPCIFCSELVSLLNLYMISSLVFNEYLLRELFQISLLVLDGRKIISGLQWCKGSLFRLWLGFDMSCQMLF